MSSWAERVHRRAADIGSVVTSCGHPGGSTPAYHPYRLEKVKFGVPLEEVCKSNDNIPGPLLVLILKLNKESPNRRDVFRAPGHQGAMKKLIHFLQAGRLVNVDNYSVYTIASVLKKFLRKIPNGIFGRLGEKELFAIIELECENEQTERLHRLLTSLPKYTQHLLVLLFGTFRVIASNAAHAMTGMTSEALGVSVAPSFFQSCVSDGKTARMEDVLKFKVATKIMKHIIDKFATHDLFGRENYEYYARVTGRILKVQDEWICSFQYPPPPRGKLAQQKYALQHSLEAEKTWLQCQCERWGLLAQEESRSTPALLTSSSSALDNSVLSLGVTPEHSLFESCARLSVSLEGPSLFALTSSPIPKRNGGERDGQLARGGGDDDDEDNYADDDADDGDDDEDDDDDEDFAHELDVANNGDAKTNLLSSPGCTQKKAKKPSRHATRLGPGTASVVRREKIYINVGDDDDDDDEDEVIVVKRRYRQNKKKTSTATPTTTQARVQQSQQRRLRAGSKSLDGVERIATGNAAKASTHDHDDSPLGAVGGVAAKAKAYASNNKAPKTRTCSRCNRGIRHSSSCSSASGGAAAANGSGMTMEELRAVNRYAESTKSLSYLPQVHERQTARMRTRSEWFLGPKDGVVSLQLPTTCSNCCLRQQQQQSTQPPPHYFHQHQNHQHFIQQQPSQYYGYLGGGSTRDMRTQRNEFGDEVPPEHDEASGNSLYMYYQKRHNHAPRSPAQQRYSQAENMDTDESIIDYDTRIHSTRAFLTTAQPQEQQQQQQQQLPQPTQPPRQQRQSLTPTTMATLSPTATQTAAAATTTGIVSNIRLSNSAESIQYPARRCGSSRRLIGLNVPRQYPLRSSLRRSKEKQIGNGSANGSAANGISSTGNGTFPDALITTADVHSMRNSIAECCSNTTMPRASASNILTETYTCNPIHTVCMQSADSQTTPTTTLAVTPTTKKEAVAEQKSLSSRILKAPRI